eukprot:COSAG06_NODE_837_length_12033_cov_4.155574_1_plen_174_part_00
MNLGAPQRRGVTHGRSHQLSLSPSSCPRYSDLHRGLSPRLSIIQSIHPSIDQSARWIDQSISHPAQSIIHSPALNPSIHPSTAAACAPSINRSICDANQSRAGRSGSIDVVSSRRLAAINRPESIHQSVSRSINQFIHPPVARSVRSISRSINQLINQSISVSRSHSLSLRPG